jgi:diacylglycerol kinase (ATP)
MLTRKLPTGRGILRRDGRPVRPVQIVVTPGSGNGRALETARQLREALGARGQEARLDVFEDLHSLRRWARAGEPSFSLLICVGGDGTQSTTAPAAMRRSVPFLPVPSGFGNLFAGALGHSGRVEHALESLETGEVVGVDVGVRKGETFLCQEGFGLLSDVQTRTEASTWKPRARWRRGLAYYGTALRLLGQTRPTPLRVTVDGRVVARDAVIVIVANVPSYGAWLPLTPEASPVDGRFDVFVMSGSRSATLTRLLGRHLRIPGADRASRLFRGRHVSVAAPDSPPVELRMLPGLLPVVVPGATARALERDRVQRRVA